MNGVDLPAGRFNEWCERRPLVADSESLERANQVLLRQDLDPSVRSALWLHDLTGCSGFEFVAFLNVKLGGPVQLTDSIILMPCFLPKPDGVNVNDPLWQATSQMESDRRLVYDGWLPVDSWSPESVQTAIAKISEALSLFALRLRLIADWRPKYDGGNYGDERSMYSPDSEDLLELNSIRQGLDRLQEQDHAACYRSLGWLAQSTSLHLPAARFLFSILAIESMMDYIENEAEDSSAFSSLRSSRLPKAELNRLRIEGIHATLDKLLDSNPLQAINEAYFNHVVGIKRQLQAHLSTVFQDDPTLPGMLFEGKPSLYDIRNKIAHGSAHSLNEAENETIRAKVWDIERLAREYLRRATQTSLDIPALRRGMKASMNLNILNMVASSEGMYQGPTHMGVLYGHHLI